MDSGFATKAESAQRISPEPHVLAQEIAGDLRSALGQIEDVLGDLGERLRAVGD
jgi:hypothetical protein